MKLTQIKSKNLFRKTHRKKSFSMLFLSYATSKQFISSPLIVTVEFENYLNKL